MVQYLRFMIFSMQLELKNWAKLKQTQIRYAISQPLSTSVDADIFLAQRDQVKHTSPLMALKIYKNHQKPSSVISELIEYPLHNVIRYYEVGMVSPYFCLMQYCQKNVREQKFSNDADLRCQQILTILRQVANGLIQLKNLRIIHADIKPQNLLMSLQEVVKICDLDFSVTEKQASEKRLRVGTFQYMAPEILLQGKCSYKSDIWSLGVLTYELYFGSHPFPNLCTLNPEEEVSFREGYKMIKLGLEKIRNKLNKIIDNTQSQSIMQLMNAMLHSLCFNYGQRKGLQQLQALLCNSSKIRKMSEDTYNSQTQTLEESLLYTNKILFSMFQHLLKDIKSLPNKDILQKKSKELQASLEQLTTCMSRCNEENQAGFEAYLQKFKVQSKKVSSIIENNLKRLGGPQKMLNYQQKISLAEHLQLTNSFLSKQKKGVKPLIEGFHSAGELGQASK